MWNILPGENGVLSLIPLFLVDRKVSLGRVSFWTSLLAQGTSILGSLSGGALISKYRYYRIIVVCYYTFITFKFTMSIAVATTDIVAACSYWSGASHCYCVVLKPISKFSFLL